MSKVEGQPLTTRQLIEELSQYPLDAVPTMAMKVEVTTTLETNHDKKQGKTSTTATTSCFVHGKIYGVQGSTGGGEPPKVSISGN